tara:strand:+ start:16 stop:399 length:384 start_codon:yes stop_codon:yes gene_type:complete
MKNSKIEKIKDSFVNAMEDDLNTPGALAAIFEMVTLGNTFLLQNDRAHARACAGSLRELCGVLGLELKKVQAPSGDLAEEIEKLIAMRNDARQNKDFKKADDIRKSLFERGVTLEDTKEGTVWRKKP